MSSLKNSLNIKLTTLKVKPRWTLIQILLSLILVGLILVGALPGYFQGGQWAWQKAPKVAYLKPVRNLRDTGLNLPNWQTLEQQQIKLGENKWLVQALEQPNQPVINLLLLPQAYNFLQPSVEWNDLKALENLREEAPRVLTFKSQVPEAQPIRARFFKGWQRSTYAVVQWYAWPKGGHYRPWNWFWGDQQARFRKTRLPWVAVSLKIPLSPLKDLKSLEPLAKQVATEVQTALDTQVFNLVYTKKDREAEPEPEPNRINEE
jgi:cyanoexosortase B-associated protein